MGTPFLSISNTAPDGKKVIASLAQVNKDHGLCLIDLLAGQALVMELEEDLNLFHELSSFTPSELLVSSSYYRKHKKEIDLSGVQVTIKEDDLFDHQTAYKWLISHFQVETLDILGLKGMVSAINAAGALFAYLQPSNIKTLKIESPENYMSMDIDVYPLLRHLDRTQTPAGKRLLKRWVTHPLLSQSEIEERQNAIEELLPQSDKVLRLLREGPSEELKSFCSKYDTATLDCLASLAEVAKEYKYIRPSVDQSNEIEIQGGRHPLLESAIPNDTFLENQGFFVITGPKSSGKSTYLYQVALIVIMAQIGSFVPAKKARIGIVDKIFSCTSDHSNFMEEMTKAAHILQHATSKSLVLLDEICKGTSTHDGLAIAWALSEHLLTTACAKTLFATHFWELTKLQVKHYAAAVQENEDGILFLYKILKGDAGKSYGLHAAKLAGLPISLIKRAKERKEDKKSPPPPKHQQFSLFSHGVLEQIQQTDTNRLTPIEALSKIVKWKDELRIK